MEQWLQHAWLLAFGHAISWLPFAWVSRVAFLYHYIPSLLLCLLSAGIAFDVLTQHAASMHVYRGLSLRRLLAVLLLLLAFVSSAYFAPLYFGWPIEPGEMQRRVRRLDVWQ